MASTSSVATSSKPVARALPAGLPSASLTIQTATTVDALTDSGNSRFIARLRKKLAR
jgi:hypothetical protein